MSNKQILHYMETDMLNISDTLGFAPLTCVQRAGDVVMIPENWGHGVVNVQQSVALATELKNGVFRLKPALKSLQVIPSNNRKHKINPVEAKRRAMAEGFPFDSNSIQKK